MAARNVRRIGKAQAREEFSSLIEAVTQGGGAIEITDYGKVAAVLLSEKEYQWLCSCASRSSLPQRDARGFFVLEGDKSLEEASQAIAEDFDNSIRKTESEL